MAEIDVERIDCDERGVDDVAITDVSMFRLERMDKNCFWLKLYRDRPDRDDLVFWIGTKDGKRIDISFDREPSGEKLLPEAKG